MFSAMAGGLLVMTGIWHATEFLMDGWRRDTRRLIPIGLAYLLLGYLLVTHTGGMIVHLAALVLATAGMVVAFRMRHTFDIRRWVIWTFIILDAAIIFGLAQGLIAG